ncbi:RNA-binding domain-containing protein [Gymnopus androsaceus JB14]|uniref:RNA-binding domain-containing protein n=1 Tax=Gymnopus androsaceus JB14 TaxID=1447944 RepID=A0A6A4HE43_9AGAR|nr:RNA-binding domain-containing protein [Gymnopus androsaceus JB14]
MEEGTKSKKTVFVGGIGDDVDESAIYQHFATFGDIIEVQLPSAATNPNQQSEAKHRGFAFVTYGSTSDAQDAIDNMDLNELQGRVIKVNLARPMKTPMQLGGNRAVWESEEWLKQNVKPLNQSGGVQGRNAAKQDLDKEASPVDEAMEE